MKRILSIAASAVFLLSCASPSVAGSKDETADLEKLLPSPGDIEGWETDGEMLSFDASSLWEYINGSAETFLMYDFGRVVAMHYVDASGKEVKVEIYGHGSDLMAFGIYSQYRSPEADFLKVGNEAFGDEYSLHFWKGRYYVKIYSYDEGPESGEIMKRFAAAVESRIADAGAEPFETKLFPPEGLVEKSITYITEGVLGSGKLPPAFAADYMHEAGKGKMYIFALDSEEKAVDVMMWYAEGIGAEISEAEAGPARYRKAAGEAPYRGRVVVFQLGRWMGIVTGFGEDEGAADSLCETAVKNIDGHSS